LPLYVGIERAMESCTLCEPWTAHQAVRLGLITRAVPALKIDGEWIPNPLAVTDRWIDPQTARIVFGERKKGEEAVAAKAKLKSGEVDLSLLDEAVGELVWSLANTFPGCITKTIESVRKHKLSHWDKNRETNRAWLGLNMMTEARTGFRAFNEGSRECRDADLLLLRRRLAEGADWGEELVDEALAKAHGREVAKS
jgi:6-oxo-cyclohex-1-ene-carbonyl-CoA hydrolase